MSCDTPKHAFWLEGKTGITFNFPHKGYHPALDKPDLLIPCKRCAGCRLEHRKMWSVRMMHEASMHNHNEFVTFTYDDSSLPTNGDLRQEDMQKFFKRLRKEFAPNKIRYVYSGEYGEQTSRPHYHSIIFGLSLADKKFVATNDRGEKLYSSAKLDEIWSHGGTRVGDVTHQSCGYVAGYMLKDSTGNYGIDEYTGKPEPYYTIDIRTGECTERKRPYARYSNRPGIGKSWFDKYHSDLFPHDECIIITGTGKARDACKVPVPPYYFRKLEELNPDMHEQIKAKRALQIEDPKNQWNNTPDRKRVRATVRDAKINLKKRGTVQQKPVLVHYVQSDV